MPEAVLRINVTGGAEMKRLFGEIVGVSKTSASTMTADWRRASQSISSWMTEATRKMGKQARAVAEAHQKAADAAAAADERLTRGAALRAAQRAQAVGREGAYRTNVYESAAAGAERAEQDQTRATEREAAKRERAAKREADTKAREARRAAREAATAARETTAAINGLAAAGSAAIVAGAHTFTAYSENVQQATMQALAYRAGAQSNLHQTWQEAGVALPEGDALSRRVYQFAEQAGMSEQDVAVAIRTGQNRFNMIARSDAQAARGMTREAAAAENMDTMFSLMRMARSAHEDPTDVVNVAGAVARQHITGNEQLRMVQGIIGMAYRGGVRLRDISHQNLGSIARSAAIEAAEYRRSHPQATEEELQGARASAVRNAVEAVEYLGPLGMTGASWGNQRASFEAELGTSGRQQRMLGAIRRHFGRPGSELEQALFEADPEHHGQMRLRAELRTFNAFGRALTDTETIRQHPELIDDIFGVAMNNPHHGASHTVMGSRVQGMLVRPRQILRMLAERDAEGRSGFDKMDRAVTGAEGEVDLSLGAQYADAEIGTTLAHQQEQRTRELLSDRESVRRVLGLEEFKSAHPYMDALFGAIPGLGSFGEHMGMRVRSWFNIGGQNDTPSQAQREQHAQAMVALDDPSVQRLATALGAAVRSGPPPVATVAPHDVVHAATVGTTHPPPGSHR